MQSNALINKHVAVRTAADLHLANVSKNNDYQITLIGVCIHGVTNVLDKYDDDRIPYHALVERSLEEI